jgi:hypothetical protein
LFLKVIVLVGLLLLPATAVRDTVADDDAVSLLRLRLLRLEGVVQKMESRLQQLESRSR